MSLFFMDDLPQKLAFVDIETTGCRNSDRIIEIGVLRVEDGKVVSTLDTLLNPDCYIPEEITGLTGITKESLENAPSFYQIKKDLLEILEGCVFVAHNVRFDLSFIKNEFKNFDITFSPKHFCTVKLSRALFPEHRHHNLDSIIERFGFKCEKRHRAFNDAKVLWDFYSHIIKKLPKETILLNLKKAMKKPTVPLKITEEVLDNLPQTPGVYIFYGANGSPLYVGKSVNIRSRVLSHFSADYLSSKEMNISQQVESIETVVTKGELGALLKESTLIKKMQPLYNRKLRNAYKLIILKKGTDKNGYDTVSMDSADTINPEQLNNVLGVFRSKKAAKDCLTNLSKDFDLCEKLLGLENTKSGCFGYRLGKCKGACVQKENTLKYNFRFMEAFLNLKIKPWPFNGPIIVKEGDEGFLINNWCYIGKITDEGLENTNEINFDLDTYKIILSFIKSSKNHTNIESSQNIKLKYLNNTLVVNPF